MRSQSVPAVARPVRRPALLFILLTPLLLGLPGEARADGRVAFTKMDVEHCDKVFSVCTWKLGCGAGNTASVELVSGAKLGTATSVALDKALTVQQFPANVHCTLSIDDGWIGTSWKKVADGTLEVPAGGDYEIELAGEGAGTVKVHVAADSLEMAGPAPAPAAPATSKPKGKTAGKGPVARQWYGVFHSGHQGEAVIVGLEWTPFKARLDALAAKGVKALHLISYKEPGKDGKRLWAGIFRSAEEEQTVLSGLEWEPFVAKWKELNGKNKRLIDMVTFDDGKKRLFTGVFQDGSDPYSLWVGMERHAFFAKWNELSAGGMRLVDLTTYRAGKNLVYSGVFRSGVGSYGLWTALTWDALAAKWKAAGQGSGSSELAQLQSYEEGNKRLFDAVLRNNTGAEELQAPLDAAAFAAEWNEKVGKGLRLIDLETLPEE
ncbi:MAG TPA: hypothetical protein VGR07_15170 [Thermoanaerobaculia bacterium]|nr:hypothetical protein [Thermoanaerobaculia bacterium]